MLQVSILLKIVECICFLKLEPVKPIVSRIVQLFAMNLSCQAGQGEQKHRGSWYTGTGKLVRFDEKMNRAKYRAILENNLLEAARD